MFKRVVVFLGQTAGGATFIYLCKTWLPKALTENAVTGWIDDRIGEAFGLSSPSASTVGSWLFLFLIVAAIIFSYHLVISRLGHQPALVQQHRAWNTRGSHIMPMILMWIGGLCFLSAMTWVYFDYQSSQTEILSALRRYVLPRHLSEEQVKIIGDYLSQFPPVKNVKFQVQKDSRTDAALPLEEVVSYAQDIRTALVRGGWQVSANTYTDVPFTGLGWQFMSPPQTAPSQNVEKNPRPNDLLAEAFKKAKVGGIGGNGAGTGPNVTEESITISVGKRRMDDSDLIGRRRARERLLRQAEELKDE
jgi:hypothetical protein